MASQVKTAQPVSNLNPIPETKGGQKLVLNYDFAVAASYQEKFDYVDTGLAGGLRTIFIDNQFNGTTFFLAFTDSTLVLACPPYSQGYFPVYMSSTNFNVNLLNAGGQKASITLFNFEIPGLIWAVTTPGAVAGTVAVSGLVGVYSSIAPAVSRNGFIVVGGTQVQAAAATPLRKRFILYNPAQALGQNIPAPEILYYRWGANAGVDDGTSFELLPGGSYDSGLGYQSSQLLSVNAATANHRFICDEYLA